MNQSLSTVVIVDDDLETAEFLCDYMEILGHRGVLCSPGPAVVACIAQHTPRLVILDMQLGVMTGVDVLHRLRDDPTLHHVPVIFFTGSADAFRQALPDYQARGVGLVVKPRTHELGLLIHRLLQPHP